MESGTVLLRDIGAKINMFLMFGYCFATDVSVPDDINHHSIFLRCRRIFVWRRPFVFAKLRNAGVLDKHPALLKPARLFTRSSLRN